MSTDLIAEVKEAARRDSVNAYQKAGFSGALNHDGGHNLAGLCPFHDDHDPSFKITTSGEHAGCWWCFPCGVGGSIIDFYLRRNNLETLTGEVLADLAGRLGVNGNGQGSSKPSAKPPARVLREQVYRLTVPQSGDVLEHVRQETDEIDPETGKPKKNYPWRRNGVWGLNPKDPQTKEPLFGPLMMVDLPLYRLPDLLKAPPGDLVIVVEGEKAADALAEEGFLALGTVCGAKVTPSEEVLRPLVDRLVFLWPDNDDAGRRHMNEIAARLRDLGITAHVIEWPEAQAKDDAADFFARGGTREDLEGLLASAQEWQPPAPAPASGPLPGFLSPSDLGNARRMVALHGGDLRYCHPAKRWWVWEGRRWQEDQTGEVERRAKDTVAAIYAEAAKITDEEARKALGSHALKSESEAKRKAMIASAQSEPGIPILPADFDADPSMLNCESGIIDLRTLALEAHRRDSYCTKLAPVRYDPDADCPLWRAFLQRVTGEDSDLQEFLQRAVGYTLTGDTSEECLFLLYGTGANGKTVFLEVLQALLGDYARKCNFSSFLVRRNDDNAPRNDLAALAGARLAVAAEADAGKRLAEGLVKEMTGEDAITARFLYAEGFTFHPQFKLWLAANHKPVIAGTDDGIWRRIRLVPFTITIPPKERDPYLKGKLIAELPGILAWALEGCAAWRAQRLGECEAVSAATDAYREESDVLADFLGSACVQAPGKAVASRDLYAAYTQWCEANGEQPLAQRTLGSTLLERGFTHKRGTGGARRWIGLGLLADVQSDASDATEAESEKPS